MTRPEPETYCPVCGRRDTWGCGHSAEQRRAARIHNARPIHLDERCHHYTAAPRPGWYPAQHSEAYLAAQAAGERYRYQPPADRNQS